MRRALKRALKAPWAQSALQKAHGVYREARAEQAQALASVAAQADIPETTPLPLRVSELPPTSRLNLLVPALSDQHVFGGIATALRCFDALRGSFESARILVTDEGGIRPGEQAFYGQWPLVMPSEPDRSGSLIVSCGMRQGQPLAVHAGDVFVATAWWTAHIAYPVLDWQDATFGPQAGVPRRLLYLIQDYEPGFYAWSSRYALAEATYRHGERTLAVFNTQILADYFEREEYRFAVSHVLEPRLNPSLAAARARMTRFDKQRVILVYGRPTVERNAFGLIVAALRQWAQHYPQAAQWQVVSAGETFEPIDLGAGCTLQPVGKLSLDDYAQQLARSAIGISLMISPHPSYPPLEMAAFGAHVLTNVYANKDLSILSSRFASLERVDPDTLAQALMARCAAFDALPEQARPVAREAIDWRGAFLSTGDELADVPGMVANWLPGS